MEAVRYFLEISRAKVQLVSFASATLGIFFGAESFEELLDRDILAFIVLFYISITFACNINCYYDVDVDFLRKKGLYTAVSYFGKTWMRVIISLELIAAMVLAVYLGWKGHFEVAILALFGIYLGWAYSSPPLRTKGKGAVGPIPVILGVYVLPIIAGHLMVDKELSILFILFVLGYAVMNLGINLVNTSEDFSEDRRLKIRTFAHAVGLRNTLNLAFNTMVLGGILALLCLMGIGMERMSQLTFASALAVLFLAFSCYTISITSLEIFLVGQEADLEKSAKIHGKNMPKWFIITRYPIWCYALILLFI
jgi:4-hydroxybenzoate polyprenyltransferase